MPQFRVIVPPNVHEGQLVRACVGGGGSCGGSSRRFGRGRASTNTKNNTTDAPDNSMDPPTVTVRVPKGAKPGDAFLFEVSQQEIDQLLNNTASSTTAAASSSASPSRGGASFSQSTTPLISTSESSRTSAASGTSTGDMLDGLSSATASKTRIITEGKLIHTTSYYSDCYGEICLGFLIGMSMVFGFFAGVLYVTDPIPLSLQLQQPES